MAKPKAPPPTLLLAAVFSRHEAALDWARDRISQAWGSICLESRRFEHSETKYYETEMGSGLRKQFLVIGGLYNPTRLPKAKLESNAWEDELAASGRFTEQRPVNIDPGYVTLSKLILASAKDRAHRIFLADGIFAEQCLYYLDHRWQSRPWTYPDYQRADFQAFFTEAREMLKSHSRLGQVPDRE